MDIIKPDIIKRFIGLPRYEPRHIDSSALMQMKFCPTSYFFRYVLGYTDKAEKVYFAWGKAYHKFREVIEKEFKKNPDEDLDTILAKGMQAGLLIWGDTKDIAPPAHFYWVNKARLIQAMLLAANHWKNEKKINKIKVLETEQSFNIELPNGVTRSGRFDQVVLLNDRQIWGRDFKTTTKDPIYFDRSLDPNDQFLGYTFAQQGLTGQGILGQLVEVVFNLRPTKADEKPIKIETKNVTYTKEQIKLWIDEQKMWDTNRNMYRENDLYPKNEKSCGFCQFHSVCKLKSEPQQILQLKSNYKVEVWDNSYED